MQIRWRKNPLREGHPNARASLAGDLEVEAMTCPRFCTAEPANVSNEPILLIAFSISCALSMAAKRPNPSLSAIYEFQAYLDWATAFSRVSRMNR
jgi:hypothetical protein